MNNRDLHFPEEGFNRPLFLPNDKLEVVSFRQGVRKRKSRTASVIAWIQLVGWLIYFAINLINHLRFNLSETPAKNSLLSQTLSAFVYEFSQITFIWVTISSILSIMGLHKMKSWGWTAAIAANSLWLSIFAFTFTQNPSERTVFEKTFFIVFALFAVVSTLCLWRKRFVFWR